jgi:peptidoglycan hydrolase-like protein with peptidoglycan-binding domain
MANPGQPTIAPGATGDVVRRRQRAPRHTPELQLVVDAISAATTEDLVINFQKADSLSPAGIFGPITCRALPRPVIDADFAPARQSLRKRVPEMGPRGSRTRWSVTGCGATFVRGAVLC